MPAMTRHADGHGRGLLAVALRLTLSTLAAVITGITHI
jgi:hypothetical protein